MDYNATQRVDCDAVFDDSTSSESDNEDGPVATLVVQPEQDKASMSFDIFKGINVVGRQNSAECRICIPLAGVSRRHAIIEVDSDTHMIYDLGSLNKTKKGKLVLKPQIRYEMSDNEVLSFGDVVCRYSKLVPLKKDVNEMASLKKTWSEDNNNIPEENLKKKRDSSNILAEGFELRSDSEFSSDDEVVPSTYPSSDQKKKQKDICVPETPEDSCVTGRTNNTAFNLGGHHSDTDIESLKDSCEASKKNANAQLKKTISNLEVYHLDPDTDVDDKSQLAEMETVEYKWGEEDLEAGIVDGPPVIMRDKGESSLKAIAKKNLNGIPDSTDDESWLGIETQPYVTKATSGQGGKSDGSRRPASSSLSKISNGGLETNFPEDLATQDWANLATQPYITDGVDPEQLPCEPEGIDQNAATADDEPRINARATDNSKVIGNCKNGEKNSRIDAELAAIKKARRSIRNKVAILKLIKENKAVLLDKNNPEAENFWEEIASKAKMMNLLHQSENVRVLRKLYDSWEAQALKKHSNSVHNESGRKSPKLNSADKFIIEMLVEDVGIPRFDDVSSDTTEVASGRELESPPPLPELCNTEPVVGNVIDCKKKKKAKKRKREDKTTIELEQELLHVKVREARVAHGRELELPPPSPELCNTEPVVGNVIDCEKKKKSKKRKREDKTAIELEKELLRLKVYKARLEAYKLEKELGLPHAICAASLSPK